MNLIVKRAVAIALLSLHLFYAGGYMLVFQYLIYKSNVFAEQQIAKGLYNPKDLVDLKVPVHMPNAVNWSGYEPISGQIQLRDACYNYVKLKITQDTLFVKCVPNYSTTRLINANVIYAKNITDLPISKKDNLPGVKKISTDIYNYEVLTFNLRLPHENTGLYGVFAPQRLKNVALDTPHLPPDTTC